MITAPDLADLLTSLTPAELDGLRRWLYQQMPTGLVDQYRAATRDTLAVAEATGEAQPIELADIPNPVLVSILDTIQTWANGRARLCLHHPDPNHPRPVWAAAWRPGTVVCAACLHLLRLPRGSEADRRCDLCGHVVAGLDHGEGIHADHTTYGPLTYMFGACPDCQKEVLR